MSEETNTRYRWTLYRLKSGAVLDQDEAKGVIADLDQIYRAKVKKLFNDQALYLALLCMVCMGGGILEQTWWISFLRMFCLVLCLVGSLVLLANVLWERWKAKRVRDSLVLVIICNWIEEWLKNNSKDSQVYITGEELARKLKEDFTNTYPDFGGRI